MDRAERIASVGWDYAARELEPVETCNLCGSSPADHVEISTRDRYGFPARVVMCARCGLGFLSPRPTAAEYAAFYADVYRPLISAYWDLLIDAETLQEGQRKYAAKLLRFLTPSLVPPPETLLDVGGSTGIVAGALSEAFEARGTVVDPSPAELVVAASAGLETIRGFAEDFDTGGRRFDLVLLCATISHVLDVAATVALLRRAVADDGHAFVDVDDVMRVVERTGSAVEAAHVDHPYYLTREVVRAYFVRAGFRIVEEGERGNPRFLLAPAEPGEPDWKSLRRLAGERIALLRGLPG